MTYHHGLLVVRHWRPFIALVMILGIAGLYVVTRGQNATPSLEVLQTKLEQYYTDQGTYPYSLADLPDVKAPQITKGSDLIYRTKDQSGVTYVSYNGMPVSGAPGIKMCEFTIDTNAADSAGLASKITATKTGQHCE